MSEAEDRIIKNLAKVIAYGFALSIFDGIDRHERAKVYAAVKADEFAPDAKRYLEGRGEE